MPGPPAPRELAPDVLISREEAVRRQQEGLTADGNARPYVHPREPPHLVARPDGTLAWRGPNFAVVIRPDGEVDFDDEDALSYDWTTASGSFDLEGALMQSLGQDPFVAERIWFMEQTAVVREEREDRARADREARAIQRMSGRLAAIWQDTTDTPEQRRRELFDAWDGSAEDDRGHRARDAVLSFVRANLPAGSEDAFTDLELARLNATRESAERFAPYE
jgi:hypothetical protein